MLRVVWNSAPSPQPSPQGGEGVGSSGIWSAMAARRNARALPIQRTSRGVRRLAEALSNKTQAGVVGRLTTELAWNTAPSPQPSPHRGEGVGSCTAWVATPVRGDAGVTSIHRRSHRVRLSAEVFSGRARSWAVGRGSMLRVAWNTAPSPQPSPQRGEGVGRAEFGARCRPAATLVLRHQLGKVIAPTAAMATMLVPPRQSGERPTTKPHHFFASLRHPLAPPGRGLG